MNSLNDEFNILANFLVINGPKSGRVIPYLQHCDDVLEKNLGLSCKLEYDKAHSAIFISSSSLKVNGIKKLKSVLKDGDIIEVEGIKLRFYLEDFNSIFRVSEIYSDLFYNESPFFKKDLMYVLLKYEFLKAKRYGIIFSIIFIKFVNFYIYQIRDILTNILKENLRETDFISDLSDNDIIIFLPFLKYNDCENVLKRLNMEVKRLLPDVEFLSNFLTIDKENIENFENFIKVLCKVFDI